MRWTLVGQLCTLKVFTLVKLPNYCGLTAGWAEHPCERLLDNQQLQPCWEAGKFIGWGMCYGSGQRASESNCCFSIWGLGRRRVGCGGICCFFLRIYCSVGREHLLGSLQYRPGKYQLVEKLLYPMNIKKAPGRRKRLSSVKLMVQLPLAWARSRISSLSYIDCNQRFSWAVNWKLLRVIARTCTQ